MKIKNEPNRHTRKYLALTAVGLLLMVASSAHAAVDNCEGENFLNYGDTKECSFKKDGDFDYFQFDGALGDFIRVTISAPNLPAFTVCAVPTRETTRNLDLLKIDTNWGGNTCRSDSTTAWSIWELETAGVNTYEFQTQVVRYQPWSRYTITLEKCGDADCSDPPAPADVTEVTVCLDKESGPVDEKSMRLRRGRVTVETAKTGADGCHVFRPVSDGMDLKVIIPN